MITLKLKSLLDEFEEWVVEGRATKIPYQEWRWLKNHSEDQVRIECDGWGSLCIFSETRCKFLVEGWSYNDGSLGTYLNDIYVNTFDRYNIATTNQTVIDKYKNTNDIVTNGKENNNMNLFKGFDFGSCENDNVKMSMYGVAVKNANNTWVSYDSKSGNVVDVDILNFSAKYLYKMPVAIKDIAVGDTVIHCRKPMFVTKIEDGKLLVIDPAAAEEKIVLPVKSPFGFDIYTKVVNLFGNLAAGASENAPFGNMLPLMLLADGDKTNDMFPLMFAMGGGKFDISNPMMMYFLMKDSKGGNDMLPFLMMSNYQNCFGNCDCDREG